MASETEKSKRGGSGYWFFIQEKRRKLDLEGTPYTGSNASADFLEDWEALSPEEREAYNKKATSK